MGQVEGKGCGIERALVLRGCSAHPASGRVIARLEAGVSIDLS
jgi:hypothetical protein